MSSSENKDFIIIIIIISVLQASSWDPDQTRTTENRTFKSVPSDTWNPRELTNQNSFLVCKFAGFIPFKIAELVV